MRDVVQIDVGASLWWSAIASHDGGWVARCDALKLTAQAETWGDLLSTIGEVVNELLIDLVETGEFEQFLTRHGWSRRSPMPLAISPQQLRFDVPFQVKRAATADAHAA